MTVLKFFKLNIIWQICDILIQQSQNGLKIKKLNGTKGLEDLLRVNLQFYLNFSEDLVGGTQF